MNKSIITILIAVVLSVGITLGLSDGSSTISQEESVYERVMRTGTIRCGYGFWDPLIIRDPITNELGGIFYDYMEALGKHTNLKIEWAEEIGWAEFPAALEANRFDAMCIGVFPSASRSRAMDFTTPIFYHPMYAWVRPDDTRFDGNLEAANSPDIIFSGQDGTMASQIAELDFPKAKLLSLPQVANQTDALVNIVTNKADIIIQDKVTVEKYLEKNPGKLREVKGVRPARVFGNANAVKIGEHDFVKMIDNATRDMLNSGEIEKILQKYEKYPGTFLRVGEPFKEPK